MVLILSRETTVVSDVTRILSKIESGDPAAAEQLLPLVYDELRKLAAAKLAQEKPGQTLQATALVHEAYVRLVDGEKAQHWDSRGHFFAAAAEAMRRILVDQARRKKSERNGEASRFVSNWTTPYRSPWKLGSRPNSGHPRSLDRLENESPRKARTRQTAILCGNDLGGSRRGTGRGRADRQTRLGDGAIWLYRRLQGNVTAD